ncbi:MAG: hypothetical protein LBM93_09175 [Oscillospiraceae bacterium]|jgi:hypothetical protein|nr:hypothetical protein [Oscillospiraceae bacterium]
MLNRISALGIVLVLLFLAGCQKAEMKNINSPDTTMPVSYHTLPVPEDGWNGEEAIKTFYLFEHQFSENFTIESLGKDFEIDRETTDFDKGKTSVVNLTYKNNYIKYLGIILKNAQSFEELGTTSLGSVVVWCEEDLKSARNEVFFNGISLGDTMDKVKTAFGNPEQEDSSTMLYYDKDSPEHGCLSFWFNDTGELYTFNIIVN